ncbi:flavin-containing superfamily amine oxidase-like protein [Cladochytrium replicatum]|nr:flavin-containing superfamily amine oxidase-like protein [Cladochytrium replicatum]
MLSKVWIGLTLLCAFGSRTVEGNFFPKIIEKDVVVLGGGGSGVYPTIRLREDFNKSVLILETKDRLGGHTENFTDPTTGVGISIGVRVWYNNEFVKRYLDRLGLQYTVSRGGGGVQSAFVDFKTGENVSSPVITPDPATVQLALRNYGVLVNKYPELVSGFNLTYPVDEDLLLPFGDFAQKFNIEPAVRTIFNYAQGLGDTLARPTIYTLKNFGSAVLSGAISGFLAPVSGDTSELYRRATTLLGDDVLLSAKLLTVQRRIPPALNNGYPILIVTATPKGLVTIRAKRILVAIPPTPQNLLPFDLSESERKTLFKLKPAGYYAAVLNNTGLPPGIAFVNAAANTSYNLPKLPGMYSIRPTAIQGAYVIVYGSNEPISDSAVKSDIIASVKRLQKAFGQPEKTSDFLYYTSHTPFELSVSAQQIRDGYYRDMYALQGSLNTFWTGAAFHTHDSTALWEFGDNIISKMLATL